MSMSMSVANVQRWSRRITVNVLALASLVMALWPTSADAHAMLVRTDPPDGTVLDAPPPQITLSFTEPVDVVEEGYRLFDTQGTVTSLMAVPSAKDVVIGVPRDLPHGTYVVDWGVVSRDSHPINGALTFSIGVPSGTVPAVPPSSPFVGAFMPAVQGVGYAALLLATGLLLFHALVVRDVDSRSARLVRGAAIIAILAHVLLVPLTNIRASRAEMGSLTDRDMWQVRLTDGPFLTLLLITLGLAGATFALGSRPSRSWVIVVGCAIALVALSIVGHPRTVEPAWLIITADVVHACVAAVWFGGLAGLAMFLTPASRPHPVTSARVVTRFSEIAGLTVVALAISGAGMAYRILDRPDALIDTTYGRFLLAKMLLLLLPIGLATWNRVWLVPMVQRAPSPASAWRRLRLSILAEINVLLVVIGLTGFLVLQSPLPGIVEAASGASLVVHGRNDDMSVEVQVIPGSSGTHEMVVVVRDVTGKPLDTGRSMQDPANKLDIQLVLPEHALGPLLFTASPQDASGTYVAYLHVPLAGDWDVSIAMRRARGDVSTVTVTVPFVEQED